MKNEIFQLLEANLERRVKYLRLNHIEAYRLYDRDRLELPLAIDIYRDNAVIHVFGKTSAHKLKQIEESLRLLLKISDFFYKNRTKENFNLPESKPKQIIVEEYGHKFSINLAEYLDTGLFLDHRETRKWIGEKSIGKTVLNTFAYTGSFSIYAAAGGAEKTYSVDLSKTYCDWIKKNLELNDLPSEKNWVYKMDTLEFFKYAAKKNLRFDIIIIDPPTFSRNKGQSFSVQKDHPALINGALELLNPQGFLLFSNNKQDFRLEKGKLLPCRIENKQRESTPVDFTQKNTHYCFVMKNI